MFSLSGNIFSGAQINDTTVLREAIKGGNYSKQEKHKMTKIINKVEKEEEKAKQPALDLRAMYGN